MCYRQGGYYFKGVDTLVPDENTISNIKIMIDRSLAFIDKYGPIVKYGFTFKGGYTDIVTAGDGDFLTKDTLWDFKVSKQSPTTAHTLQLLMYYIMGKHSVYKAFDNITKIGIFNPRLNKVYIMEVSKIPQDVVTIVTEEIIGYDSETLNFEEKYDFSDDMEADLITLPDLLKKTGYSRSVVMRWYMDEGLPLIKIKNRYYIDLNEFDDWVEEKHKREIKSKILFTVVMAILLVGLICFYVKVMGRIM